MRSLPRWVAVWILSVTIIYWWSVTMLAQGLEPAATAPTGSLTAPPGEWQSSIVLGFFVTSAWEWLKRKQWVQFADERVSFWAQRIAGVVVAMATAAGLNYTFDPAAGRLVIDGLTIAGVLGATKDTAWSYVVQQVMYHKVVKPDAKQKAIPLTQQAKTQPMQTREMYS